MSDKSLPSQDHPTDRSPDRFLVWIYGHARRVIIFVIGSTVLLIGIAMIVLPGPAVVVIPLGLAILATEFVWAKRWLDFARRQFENLSMRTSKSLRKTEKPDEPSNNESSSS